VGKVSDRTSLVSNSLFPDLDLLRVWRVELALTDELAAF
jgi:hypothetical protein